MRINVYAEEMTDRVEIISKKIGETTYTGVRFFLELPMTINGQLQRGPFIHGPGDDDSSAVTFWGKKTLKVALQKALLLLSDEENREDNKSGIDLAISELSQALKNHQNIIGIGVGLSEDSIGCPRIIVYAENRMELGFLNTGWKGFNVEIKISRRPVTTSSK